MEQKQNFNFFLKLPTQILIIIFSVLLLLWSLSLQTLTINFDQFNFLIIDAWGIDAPSIIGGRFYYSPEFLALKLFTVSGGLTLISLVFSWIFSPLLKKIIVVNMVWKIVVSFILLTALVLFIFAILYITKTIPPNLIDEIGLVDNFDVNNKFWV